MREVRNSISKRWISVRCPISQVQLFDRYPMLRSITGKQSLSHRFRQFTYLKRPYIVAKLKKGGPNCRASEDEGPLSEDAYYRESAAKLKVIIPRHKMLSNNFCKWLHVNYGVRAERERQRVDVRFVWRKKTVLAELKVCYGVGATKSIREALGQLLEYNHYPVREPSNVWLIIIDNAPSDDDCQFIEVLREKLSLPLTLGWINGKDFDFYPGWPLV